MLARVDPISIDAAAADARAVLPATRALLATLLQRKGRRRMILGVDRLDYTKGILERLCAFELLLERRPDLRGSLCLTQIATSSRG